MKTKEALERYRAEKGVRPDYQEFLSLMSENGFSEEEQQVLINLDEAKRIYSLVQERGIDANPKFIDCLERVFVDLL